METKTFTLQMQENAEYIFERYKGLIYKIARDILDDSLLAEDCLQEVVLKLALLPGKLNTDEYEYPDAFVAIVARNQALDMLKKQKRELPTEDVELQKLSNFATICKEDRYFVEENGFTKEINDCLKQMTQKDRDAIILREVYVMPYFEIAQITNEKVNTVEQRFHRAKRKLKEMLLKYERED
ncbi:MAG: sigma-70 family RNA polymerase sigma factor [Firmicutes bacterium]|nr:sigma-70 family RNA polymerase sigma factor [Bacillota bacterium]